MTLSQKQRHFTRLVGKLIDFAYAHNMELTFGDAYRSPEQAAANAKAGKGIVDSLHCKRLAVDFNLFVDGVYQRDTAAYRTLGEYWESLDPLCQWGGSKRFKRKDGNHFEFRDS